MKNVIHGRNLLMVLLLPAALMTGGCTTFQDPETWRTLMEVARAASMAGGNSGSYNPGYRDPNWRYREPWTPPAGSNGTVGDGVPPAKQPPVQPEPGSGEIGGPSKTPPAKDRRGKPPVAETKPEREQPVTVAPDKPKPGKQRRG